LHGSGASGGLQSALLPVYECSGKPVAVRIVMQILVGRYVGWFSGLSMRRIAQADRAHLALKAPVQLIKALHALDGHLQIRRR
jgi:hypothetical protein